MGRNPFDFLRNNYDEDEEEDGSCQYYCYAPRLPFFDSWERLLIRF